MALSSKLRTAFDSNSSRLYKARRAFLNSAVFFLMFWFVTFTCDIRAQITRGAAPGEIYISNEWYGDNQGNWHYAIYRSTTHGQYLNLKYEALTDPLPGEMKIVLLLGDATSGAIYNYGWNELWVSLDYGINWEYREDYPGYTKYFSGALQGLIFKGNSQGLFKSTNFGLTFELLPITVTCPFTEVGFTESEFYGIYGEPGLYYNFVHTYDYGQTYTQISIDSTVAFWQIEGKYPEISRGTEPGELYLVSWWPLTHYEIFHSLDTGYTWKLKYVSDYIDLFIWRVQYTAGREPGSFYVKRSRYASPGDHMWVYIDYSSDYGETFTTYFHDLDSLYTSVPTLRKDNLDLKAFPNPFSDKTTILFQNPHKAKSYEVKIFNVNGQLIRQINTPIGTNKVKWEGKDKNGNLVPRGLYFIRVTQLGQTPENLKIIRH